MSDDTRTPAEQFYKSYGYVWPYSQRTTGPIPSPVQEDMSETYWLVWTRAKELGLDKPALLDRLRDIEEEADEWLNTHGRPQADYDEMIAEYDRVEARWEGF